MILRDRRFQPGHQRPRAAAPPLPKKGDVIEFSREMGLHDATREHIGNPDFSGRWVVVEAGMGGGGHGHGPNDVYPDGWRVQVRRVRDDGSVSGCMFSFYMSGAFTNLIDPSHVQVVGKAEERWTIVGHPEKA